MPTRVATQQELVNEDNSNKIGRVQASQSKILGSSRVDDSSTGGTQDASPLGQSGYLPWSTTNRLLTGVTTEGKARKRLQKSTSGGDVSLQSILSTNRTIEPRSNFSGQRSQSIKDKGGPSASCSVDNSPSKWSACNPSAGQNSTNRPNLQSEQYSKQVSNTKAPRLSLGLRNKGDAENTTGTFDFLPPVSFDDFHASIASENPDIGGFPISSGSGKFHTRESNGNGPVSRGHGMKGHSKFTDSSNFESRIGRSGSFLRRHDSSARQSGQPPDGDIEVVGQPNPPLTAKTRRQSLFPAPPINTGIERSPRKSVGPGLLGSDVTERIARTRVLGASQADYLEDEELPAPGEQMAGRSISGYQTLDQVDGPRSSASSRSMKAKSLQPPSRRPQDNLTPLLMTPDQFTYSSISTARSPVRSTGRRTNTPSSSKRLSVMPNAYATGLGARTISPTDTRRMKRMSMMPNAPPLPHTPTTPTTPQLDTQSLETQTAVQSPPLIPRKSVTPSSSRATPDHNRKSYSSGISNSSNTSYNSIRTSTGSIRIPQSLSTSRLPTPKTRIDNTSAVKEESVPPVPAIPKAYESPKTEIDQPFFSARKSSLPIDSGSLDSSSTGDCVPPTLIDEQADGDREVRQRRGTTITAVPGGDRKPGTNTSNNLKSLQPLRLPPLNLLPLSTPTAAKIASLPDEPTITNPGNMTPPPKHGPAATPSTPMTASKTSFFSRSRREEEPLPAPPQVRSSSSHYALRSEASSFRAPSSSSSNVPTAPESRAGRKAMSPFISSSLPKTSGDFGYHRPKYSGEYNTIHAGYETRSHKLTGPRTLASAKSDAPSRHSSPVEPSTTSFGSSLRRKLSLTRRRSSSKGRAAAAERDSEYPPEPPKHNHMPPPRLPASATWSGPFLPSPSPTRKSSYIYSKKHASNSAINFDLAHSQSDVWIANGSPKKEPAPTGYTAISAPTRTTRSTSTLTLNSLGSKASLRETRNAETHLDRDDLIAEEEMKRLALKRKDTESAAVEMDELRRRATPRERVSSSQALRTTQLNIFERGEIVDYKEIYFWGTPNAQKHMGDLAAETANFGYDDDRGDYNIVNGDHVAYRYEIIDILGKGSFGQVVRCVDHKAGGLVAIKIIRNKKRFHQQALVEVNILQKLREWDPQNKHSMVNFTQSFYFRGHLCISTELLGMNLYEFIKCHDFRGFSLKLIRRFAKQLLSSLILLKSHKVIHCDLKPENILLAHPAHSEIKVIDFGSSCLENEKVYTYIQSRFYRSPEVILGMTYGLSIDMWSLGCILAELLTGYPIFPGENEQEQLACIMEVFGPPEKHLIEKSTRKKLFFDSLGKPRLTVSSKGKRRRPSTKSLQQALKCEDEAFLDFITRCLRWDPERRLKPDEAILHEFITGSKPANRTRLQTSTANNSPIKRYNSLHTPAAIRPLPETPATSFKNGILVKNRDLPSASPSKSTAAPKRHSTINGLQSSAGTKRSLNGATITGSALPRVTPRTASGKLDFAAAAAVASLVSAGNWGWGGDVMSTDELCVAEIPVTKAIN